MIPLDLRPLTPFTVPKPDLQVRVEAEMVYTSSPQASILARDPMTSFLPPCCVQMVALCLAPRQQHRLRIDREREI